MSFETILNYSSMAGARAKLARMQAAKILQDPFGPIDPAGPVTIVDPID
jgi:hypothetical protein